MKFNVFEGARRIVLLMQALVLVICLWNVVFDEPYFSLIYETYSPVDSFQLATNQKCDYLKDEEETIYREDSNGEKMSITLCFRGRLMNDGTYYIPYVIKDGKEWSHSKYSDQVKNYITQRSSFFVVPSDIEDSYSDAWWKEKFSDIWEAIKITALFLVFLPITSFLIGWIIRGFFGIPTGMDSRPKADSLSES